MRQQFSRWMIGRNGVDQLARGSFILSLVLIFITMITKSSIAYFLGIAALGYGYFRMVSKNLMQRGYENEKYVRFLDHTKDYFKNFRWKTRSFFVEAGRKLRYGWKQNSTKNSTEVLYKIYKCPSCKQKVRVPKGRGKIEISCPKCQTKFIKRT